MSSVLCLGLHKHVVLRARGPLVEPSGDAHCNCRLDPLQLCTRERGFLFVAAKTAQRSRQGLFSGGLFVDCLATMMTPPHRLPEPGTGPSRPPRPEVLISAGSKLKGQTRSHTLQSAFFRIVNTAKFSPWLLRPQTHAPPVREHSVCNMSVLGSHFRFSLS